MSRPRHLCSHCGRSHRVLLSGGVEGHRDKGARCPGSGLPGVGNGSRDWQARAVVAEHALNLIADLPTQDGKVDALALAAILDGARP